MLTGREYKMDIVLNVQEFKISDVQMFINYVITKLFLFQISILIFFRSIFCFSIGAVFYLAVVTVQHDILQVNN